MCPRFILEMPVHRGSVTYPGLALRDGSSFTTDNKRFIAREQVLLNSSISRGARLLYMAIDHMSGPSGQAWPLQSSVAGILGAERRMVRYWLKELTGYVTIIRRRGASVYRLKWAVPERQPIATHRQRERQPIAYQSGNPLPVSSLYMNQEIEPIMYTCVKCEDFGFVSGLGACDCLAGKQVSTRLQKRRA